MADQPRLVLVAKPDCSACDDAEPAVRGIAAALGIAWRREERAEPRAPLIRIERGGASIELAAIEIDPASLADAAGKALARLTDRD